MQDTRGKQNRHWLKDHNEFSASDYIQLLEHLFTFDFNSFVVKSNENLVMFKQVWVEMSRVSVFLVGHSQSGILPMHVFQVF